MKNNQTSKLNTRNFPKYFVEADIKGWYEVVSYFTSRKQAREYRNEIVKDGYANKAHVRQVQVNIVG